MAKKVKKSLTPKTSGESSNFKKLEKFIVSNLNQLKIGHQHDFNFLRKAIQGDLRTSEDFYTREIKKLDSKIDKIAVQVSENVSSINELKKQMSKFESKIQPLDNLLSYLDKKFAMLESWNQEKDMLGQQVDRANSDNRKQDKVIDNHETRVTKLEQI